MILVANEIPFHCSLWNNITACICCPHQFRSIRFSCLVDCLYHTPCWNTWKKREFSSFDNDYYHRLPHMSYSIWACFCFRRGRINIPALYLHRFLRLTPLLAAAILISLSILQYATSGPRWPILLHTTRSMCEENWWKTLLYVQNYVSSEKIVSFTPFQV